MRRIRLLGAASIVLCALVVWFNRPQSEATASIDTSRAKPPASNSVDLTSPSKPDAPWGRADVETTGGEVRDEHRDSSLLVRVTLDEAPCAEATIMVADELAGRTDGAGVLHVPRDRVLRAGWTNRVARVWAGKGDAAAQAFVDPDAKFLDLDLRRGECATLVGSVHAPYTHAPVPDAEVRVAGRSTRTDSNGEFSIEALPDELLPLEVWLDGIRVLVLAQWISEPAELELPPSGEVIVHLQTPTGITGGRIELSAVYGSTTQSIGARELEPGVNDYAFRCVPETHPLCTLVIAANDHVPLAVSLPEAPHTERSFVLTPVSACAIRFPGAQGTNAHATLEGALDESARWRETVDLDSSGVATFRMVPESGDARLEVVTSAARGWGEAQVFCRAVDLALARGSTVDDLTLVPLRLRAPSRPSGAPTPFRLRLTRSPGRGVTSREPCLYTLADGSGQYVTLVSDAEGVVEIGLPPGEVLAEVDSFGGEASARLSFTLPTNGELAWPIESASVDGELVLRSEGVPLRGRRVSLRPLGGDSAPRLFVSDPEGVARVRGLAPGRYACTVEGELGVVEGAMRELELGENGFRAEVEVEPPGRVVVTFGDASVAPATLFVRRIGARTRIYDEDDGSPRTYVCVERLFDRLELALTAGTYEFTVIDSVGASTSHERELRAGATAYLDL